MLGLCGRGNSIVVQEKTSVGWILQGKIRSENAIAQLKNKSEDRIVSRFTHPHKHIAIINI